MCKIIINYAKHSIEPSDEGLSDLVITWIHSRLFPRLQALGVVSWISWSSCSSTSTLPRHANNKELRSEQGELGRRKMWGNWEEKLVGESKQT